MMLKRFQIKKFETAYFTYFNNFFKCLLTSFFYFIYWFSVLHKEASGKRKSKYFFFYVWTCMYLCNKSKTINNFIFVHQLLSINTIIPK